MVQVSGTADDGQRGSSRDAGGSFRGNNDADAAESETAGAAEAADNEGFHSARQDSDEVSDGGVRSSEAQPGSPSGGPEDPPEEDQSPAGEQDPEQNPPLPRTWN